jgi:hypothetical protein
MAAEDFMVAGTTAVARTTVALDSMVAVPMAEAIGHSVEAQQHAAPSVASTVARQFAVVAASVVAQQFAEAVDSMVVADSTEVAVDKVPHSSR